MNPICYELAITVPEKDKDLVGSILNDLGVTSFVEGAIDCDIEFDYEDPNHTDYYGSLAKDVPLVVYSEDLTWLKEIQAQFQAISTQQFAKEFPTLLRPIADQEWRESWKASFKPIDVQGVIAILPPWEDPALFPQPHKIIIDPGMAFGTGQHETTRLCLNMMLETGPGKRVFDVGTGSGILAIASKMLGSDYVFGCDIEPESVEIAERNAMQNHTPQIEWTAIPVDQIPQNNFDLVFANIQNKPLRKIMGHIVQRTVSGGKVLISGILSADAPTFAEFLETQGLKVLKQHTDGDWQGFLCQKVA